MEAIKWIVLIVLISIPIVVDCAGFSSDDVDDEPGIASQPTTRQITEPPYAANALPNYRSGARTSLLSHPMGLKLGFRPDFRTKLFRDLDEIQNLLSQLQPSNAEMKKTIQANLKNLLDYLNEHKNEIFGVSNPEDIVIFINIMKVILRSNEVNVVNIDFREVIKKSVGKIVSFAPDARAMEFTQVFCGTFEQLFVLSEMLEKKTVQQNNVDKIIKSVHSSIEVFTSDFPDLRYTPDIVDKLAQVRMKLNEEQEEDEDQEVVDPRHPNPPRHPNTLLSARQELLKLLESLPFIESIDRVLADNASALDRMRYYNSETLCNAFLTIMPLASIKNYTSKTITRILMKDLTCKRTHHVANADRDEKIDHLLTRLIDAPDGRTYYKFTEHRDLVEAVKDDTIDMQKLLHGEIKRKLCENEFNQQLKIGLDINIKIDNVLRDIREESQSPKIGLALGEIQRELNKAASESAESSSKFSLGPQFARELAKNEQLRRMDRSTYYIQSSVQYHKRYV